MFSWLRKFRISNRLDADAATPPPPAKGSDDLRRYHESMARVDAALRSQVHEQRTAPSRDLRRRTIDALQETTYEENRSFIHRAWGWPRLAGALALVAVVAAVAVSILTRPSITPPTPDRPDGSFSEFASRMTDLRPPNVPSQMGQPMLAEATNLLADVRKAGSYMADRNPLRTASGQWAFSPTSRNQ